MELGQEQIDGMVDRVTFHNAANGYAVLRVILPKEKEPVVVVGVAGTVCLGEKLRARGNWIVDPRHGKQFKAEHITCLPPTSAKAIERFLGSGMIKGLGPGYAKRIVDAFGDKTLEILDQSPSHLRQIKGLTKERIGQIRNSWIQMKTVRELIVFLQEHGLGPARAMRIHKTYGEDALRLIRDNPYRLATDIQGIGFLTADSVARSLGIPEDSPLRARAALRHTLLELTGEGHTGFPEEQLIGQTSGATQVPETTLLPALQECLADGSLIKDTSGHEPWIYLKELHTAEEDLAKRLVRLQAQPVKRVELSDVAMAEIEGRTGLSLAEGQMAALRLVAENPVVVITGGPGVGKTTLVRAIVELARRMGWRVILGAPTGRASRRLSEATGLPAKTLHRILEFDPGIGGFRKSNIETLDGDLFLIDEVSMVDLPLMDAMIKAITLGSRVVFVGDVDQLPSVGPGAILSDLIESRTLPVGRLTEVFRQARESRIVQAAHALLEGQLPETSPDASGDFFLVEAQTPEEIQTRIIALATDRIPKKFGLNPVRDIQVLTPMNKNELGSKALNAVLRDVFNPPKGQDELERFGWVWRVGDKVIQTENNYQKSVFNGDLGIIVSIDTTEAQVSVEFEGKVVDYEAGELDELAPAWAMTVHKSQGSEYPAVLIVLHTQHFPMLQRNLVYTAITRGKKLVVVVGNRRALQLASERMQSRLRYTALARRIKSYSTDREVLTGVKDPYGDE
jgi:exodeoxyribonuclease V alpha subunit